jgi:putative transposase
VCNFFGITRQAYYKQLRKTEKVLIGHELVVELVQEIRRSNKQMGGKKLYHLLKDDITGIAGSMGRDKFFGLLRKRDLLVSRRRKYAVTTQSHHRFRVHDNKLKGYVPSAPHQAWVCDITYVRVVKGFVYLFLLTDAYSRKIVGWELNGSLGVEGALSALRRAINQCPCTKGLIHHSDRGFQYCANVYVNQLKSRGITISMAEAGNCYENAMAERVNGILKGEYGLDETFASEKEALQAVRQGIKAYNEQRPHWSLGLKIPAKVHVAA